MKEKIFCIILINYNSLDDTIECLKSIYQSNGVSPFVVVVDNASNNQSDVESQLSFYPELKVILNRTNVGFGRANNIGIDWIFDNIKSDYIYILNNDTTIEKDSILMMADLLSKQGPEIGMVAPKILVYSNPDEVWYEGADIDFKKVTPRVKSNTLSNYTQFASGCAMFFRYDTLKKLKGFDPFFFMYDEDVELCLRMKNEDILIYYLPTSIVYHKCQGSQTKEKNIPSNQLHPYHPSLLFYIKNTIVNRKYIMNLHLVGLERVKSIFFHSTYWILKSAQYFLFNKPQAGIIVLKYLFFKTSKNQKV
jgi:GT2 family glycosyltransferase